MGTVDSLRLTAGAGAADRNGTPQERSKVAVCFWDMDHTLVANDCDSSWKLFLMGKGLVPVDDLEVMRQFSLAYDQGKMDTKAYGVFQLKEFAGRTQAEVADLAREHFESMVRPAIYAKALDVIVDLRRSGAKLCLVTATNLALAAPVAAFCGFEDFVATEPEVIDGRYTGRIAGPYCFGPAKIPPMVEFCRRHGHSLAEAAYYGDSINDVPILEAVGHPVAANPSPLLRKVATERGWRIQDFA